ncbi:MULTISPECIES: GGDEF domain-containing response regulator [Shewanella]|uniref:GGDEF domain-containing response regulator n=1 Tax=Shewanella TaxID=22 RepID=UPI001CFF4F70|nr:diguanylate cyclase [Shewanella indica]
MDAFMESNHNILIVDDDRSVIFSLNSVLSELASIRFAVNAQQAFTLIHERKPDLILLDVELPDLSGLDVCKQIKADPLTGDIPILFITSNVEAGFEENVFSAGAADYISKPLNPVVVAARTKTHLAYLDTLRQMKELAHLDSLTTLSNRLAFDEKLKTEFSRAQREGQPLSLVMIDIDEFKKFNDHFGHLAGDDCIRDIAARLKKVIKRPADLAARYGGEEFALILPNTNEAGTVSVVEKLMELIDALHIKHAPDATFPQITISAGYSTLHPEGNGFKLVNERSLIKSADDALYKAKLAGRNCITFNSLIPDTSPSPNV